MTVEQSFVVLGFVAQGTFAARFIVQWIASERSGRSVIPMAFWYLSFSGGLLLTVYAVYRRDPVFIVGQASGLVVYTRNIVLRLREQREDAQI